MPEELGPGELELPKGEHQGNIAPIEQNLRGTKQRLSEIPVNPELGSVIEEAEPVFSSPQGESVGAINADLEQFDHAKAVKDKTTEARVLENILADSKNEIMVGDIAMKFQDDANEYGQVKAE